MLMRSRFNYARVAPGVYDAMDALDRYLGTSALEKRLLLLVQLRASQINGCAYCVDMHWKDLRVDGESEQRLYALIVWRETPFYTDRERAALEWTESVTLLADNHVADDVYARIHPHFTDRELADLTLAISTINAWNRLSIAARLVPGSYQPATAEPVGA
jgi:AhpD family alkylhydroperoxidase